MSSAMTPGWYYAQGDPIGTNRYWDGAAWVGGPQPLAGQAPVSQGFAPPGYGAQSNVSFASWGTRAAALIIDLLCVTAVAFLLFGIMAAVLAVTAESTDSSDASSGVAVLVVLLGFFGFFVAQIAYFGAYQGARGYTLGKNLMSIQLVKETTLRPPGIGVGLGRYFLASLLGLVTGVYAWLDYLWPMWDNKTQRLTDKIVGTIVIRT